MKRPAAGGFNALRRIPLDQPHNAQTGTEALLRMFPALHDARSQLSGIGAVFTCPVHDPGGGPLQVFPVSLGHMFRQRAVPVSFITACMTGDATVFEKYFHDTRCQPHLHLFFDKLIGNAVEVIVDFDVIVDVDPGFLAFGVFIGCGRKRLQGREKSGTFLTFKHSLFKK